MNWGLRAVAGQHRGQQRAHRLDADVVAVREVRDGPLALARQLTHGTSPRAVGFPAAG
ncbi:hypothetical protein [Candidatus Frankia nodulisporulans]|uniref:hypothetical protein n=1 Tax=Candidatus Frankia nodulisporulans TaxID=2060052 RepID=UPI001CDBE57F|nr:hypothetical protein [Candidatus Frankia nodulisporulans]